MNSPAEVAAIMAARGELRTDDRAVVVANPLPVEEQLDPRAHDQAVAAGLAAAERAGVAGKELTPFLLEHLRRETAGASLAANVRLVVRNAELAARIAVAASPA